MPTNETATVPDARASVGPASPAAPNSFPFLDLKAQFETIREEIIEAVTRVLEHQHFILGPEVDTFERQVAPLTGCQHAIGCASGSDALVLALLALEIGSGDEVITTPFTFIASAGSIARLGAKPVFADIDPFTFNVSAEAIESAITPRTRAIMPVHLFGLSAEIDKIREIGEAHKLPIIGDAAQAIRPTPAGQPVGTLGPIGCFSFFPSKNLGGAGDGGLVTTNDSALAERLRVLRVHGARKKYEYERLGVNSRLDALQAEILVVKLRHLNEWTNGRRANAERYRNLVKQFGIESALRVPLEPASGKHVYNQFTVRVNSRDEL